MNNDNDNGESKPDPSSPPPPPPEGSRLSEDEAERMRKILSEINRLEIRTNNLVDNGLLGKKQEEDKVSDELDKVFRDIQDNLYTARKYIDAGDLSASENYLSQALRSYDKALYTPSRIWRFSNVYAGSIWIYLVGFLVGVLGFYWYQLDSNFLNLHIRIQEVVLHAATWGSIGAILRGLWFLKNKVSDRRYRNSFRIYFLSTPFMGGLFVDKQSLLSATQKTCRHTPLQ